MSAPVWGLASISASLVDEVYGYQWMTTKSALVLTIARTTSFQSPESPEPTIPSGPKVGVVSTTPTLIDGSTAFMAAM
ncbi:hypothetical protein [Streptomyces sp. NPDC057694]|uniref:hypothetical protein n=1 Tax=Streptomyces sp. NPDC057694 TaxID=3346216 RepID=UPI0036CDD0E1